MKGDRVEPVTLILAALAAGASAGALDALKDDVREKAKAAYERLRGLAGKRVAGTPHGELALKEYASAPQKWEGLLGAELTEAGAAGDGELTAAAKALMELVDQAGAKSGKYNVTIKNSKGVQVGDGNIQVNRF
jgi:RIP homotypic interaction motif